MTATPAPREDGLELPESWSGYLLPKRGKRIGEPVTLDPEAPNTLRVRTARYEKDLRAAMANPLNQAVAPSILRHLDGEADAYGAGATAALLSTEKHGSGQLLRPEVDAWTIEHGLPFAVCAAIAKLSLNPWATDYRTRVHNIADRQISDGTVANLSRIVQEIPDGIGVVRGLLAAASETEYDQALAGAATFRTTPVQRFVATALFPEQETWAAEICAEHRSASSFEFDAFLWYVIDRPELLAGVKLSRLDPYWTSPKLIAAAVDNLGTAALPHLLATLRNEHDPDRRRWLLDGIAVLPSDEAMAHLVGNLIEPQVFPAAADAAARFPRRALRAIAAAAETTPPELRPRLAALAAVVPEALRDTANVDTAQAPEAPPEALPPLLTTPPWTQKRPKRKAAVIAGLQAPAETRIVWAEGEQERWAVPAESYHSRLTDGEWEHRLRSLGNRDHGRMNCDLLVHAPDAIAAKAFDRWTGGIPPYTTDYGKTILARFGTPAAARLVESLRNDPIEHATLPPIHSLAAARLAADWLDRLKTARASAIAWFDRHGTEGARMLVPDALGEDKKARRLAENALVFLALRHGPDAVLRAAEAYGPEAAAAIAALLDGDPLEPGVKVPKPGSWIDPAQLPQVLLADGERALPSSSLPHLITVLALATPDYPYPGLEVVAETCDRGSLTRFSRALFQLWLAEGAPSKDAWALTQLAHFADDATVRLLAAKVRQWPGQSHHKRAVNGLGVLGAIGSETALRAIQGISEKVKFKALKAEAGVQIGLIAAGLGLSSAQLADRLVPDFGLGAEPLVLDYGPRRFTVAFDEQLRPYVTDDTGKPRKALPKPGAKDDAELAEAAYQRFALLKKELRTAAADQVSRLEAAMADSRTWSVEEFERFFAAHPLVKHLARRLVWLAGDTGFRIAEDGTYSDVNDESVALPDDAVIRLAHPVHLEPKEIDAWAEVLSDYEILQPFEQLSRPVMAFTDEELASGHLARFDGADVEIGRLLALTKRGWHRAAPEDAGVEPGIYYPIPGGGYVTIALDPGIWVGMIAENPIQRLDGIFLSDRLEYWRPNWRSAGGGLSTEIDPVTASEILGALTSLNGVQSGQ
ncbi:DUF4132 domain-containing protein [Glycomyces luteolus]|uniref:DUF4132 domain-containing protein n=1 Tax=Glycomyces luteolus TaxID=2670330 RepID=A0A9X3PAH0_9ACTN|nr:DUF4132 domain-containing protein [Glycomyces luteolus]MDA1359933.1 DUF4132 domain-containing protein [Glycomyces luteolus]